MNAAVGESARRESGKRWVLNIAYGMLNYGFDLGGYAFNCGFDFILHWL